MPPVRNHGHQEPIVTASHHIFRAGAFTSWDQLAQEVSDLLSSLGPDRVIAVSHSEDKQSAVVIVWYWE
jgi:pimeloyl-ACP methyl ester carboxylesterase